MRGMPSIGPIRLASPFCQAGLAGYSDRAMRVVARRRGCPYAVTEALLDTILLAGGQGLKRSIDLNSEDHPLAGQVIGSEPHTMAAAARILADHGHDVVDLNFACPVKKIKNRARGGHMLRDVDRGRAIVRAVRDACPDVVLTVSLRRAFDDAPESRDALFQIIDEMWRLDYAAVRVHGRTVEQKYLGRSDRSVLVELRQRYPGRTILGSGDVFTAHDAVDLLRQTGVDVVWIARGAIGNPWIFEQATRLLAGEQLAPPTVAEQKLALWEHFRMSMEIHGEQLAGRRMRKQGIKYARFHPDSTAVKSAFIEIRSLREWELVLERHYSDDRPGVWPAANAADEVNESACDARS